MRCDIVWLLGVMRQDLVWFARFIAKPTASPAVPWRYTGGTLLRGLPDPPDLQKVLAINIEPQVEFWLIT
jgi:hypothetical protein